MSFIQQWLKEHNIDEVECLVPDMAGVARGKLMPAEKFSAEPGMRLPEHLFLLTVTGDYPDKSSEILNPADMDVVMRPALDTIRIVPWAQGATAQVIHDSFYHDGKPVKMAPRYVLQRVLERYRAQGWQPVVAPELEFYLVKPNTDADYPLEPPIGRSGRQETGRQPYGIDAVNEFDPLFEDLYDYCDAQGLKVDTLIHESGAAQMEVNLLHGDPLDLADQAFLFKRTLREVALRHKMYATFMAKPMENEPGSAMHIHQSVVDSNTGRNVFSNDVGAATELFHAHIAGLQRYLMAAMPMLAPYVNSYRRITPYSNAPINLQWGYDNRTAGLRVPYAGAVARRVENRLAGADCNPYLAIAASLACGYIGMMEKLSPSEPATGSAYELTFELPRNLLESVDLLNACEPLCEILGPRFVQVYSELKICEFEAFRRVISPWEREFLLLNV